MWKNRIMGGPCQSCTCPEHPDQADAANGCPFLGPPLDFVYLYIDSAARGDELRFSIRSVFKNYLGAARIWVVGDRPNWYRGLHIPVPRVKKSIGRARLDRAKKFYHIATAAHEIHDRFVAMQDDVYLINPVTYFDLNRRWVNDKPLTPEKVLSWQPKNAYLKQKKRTALKLFDHGISYVSDYSTHTPKFYFKSDLQRIIERYDALYDPLVCTILFDNAIQRTDLPYPIQPYRMRLKTQNHTAQQLAESCQGKLFLNHLDQSWTQATRDVLESLFPQPSVVEK